MFRDVLFVLTEQAAAIHADLIQTRLAALLPPARLRIVWRMDQIQDSAEVDLLIAPQIAWLPDIVAICPRLRWLHLLTAGSERLFEMGLDKGSYRISKSTGVNAVAVAEYVMGAMLFFSKQFGAFLAQQQERLWRRMWLSELYGKKVVIIGLGHIGRAIAERSLAMGMQVVGVSHHGQPVPGIPQVVSSERLKVALEQAHFLVISVPLTSSTRSMVDRSLLLSLPPGSFVVDVSRGGVLDEKSLVDALQSGHLGGAALDVFETEPLPANSPLWTLPNVLLTPHVAGTTERFMERALDIFASNLHSLEETGDLVTPVDRGLGY